MASVHALPSYNVKIYVTVTLDHTNFLTWKTQIVNFFTFNRLIGYIDGSIPPPPTTKASDLSSPSKASDISSPPKASDQSSSSSSSLSLDDWMAFDRFVQSCITATLSDSLVHQTNGFSSAHDLWNSLEESFMQQSMARKTLLRTQLLSLKKKNLSIAEYLQNIRVLADSLAAIGDSISDSELVITALNGLPTSYRAFITSVENLTTPPSFTQLRAKLLTYEQRLLLDEDSVSSLDHSSAMALLAKFHSASIQDTSSPSSTNKSPVSHSSSPKSNANTGGSKYRGKCQICKKQGHSANRCRFRYAASNISSHPSPFAGLHSQQSNPSYQPPLLPTPPSTWIPDSGATSHMVNDASMIQHIQPYAGSDRVTIGDGTSLPIKHIGSSTFTHTSRPFTLQTILHVPRLSRNLLSVSRFTKDNNVSVEFYPSACVVKDLRTGMPLLKGRIESNLYTLPVSSAPPSTPPQALVASRISPQLWHNRLGHPSKAVLSTLRNGLPAVFFTIFVFEKDL